MAPNTIAACPSCKECMFSLSGWFGLLDVGVGVFIAAAGVNSFMSMGGKFVFDTIFIGAALVVAGATVAALSLANCVPVSRYFLFLNRFWGRGGLYVFLGVLCVNGNFWRILFGGVTITIGIVYLLYSCALPDAAPKPLSGCTLCDSLDTLQQAPGVAVQPPKPGNAAGPFAAEAESGAAKQPFREAGVGGSGTAATSAGPTTTARPARTSAPDNPFAHPQGRTPFDAV